MLNRFFCVLTLLIFQAAGSGFSQQRMGNPIKLFDGHTFNGWTKGNGQPVDSGWQIVDGTITRVSQGGDIYSEVEFENFALSFQWKIAAGGNSGIKYRVKKYGNSWLGCEYQVLDDQGKPYNKHAAGALYDVFAPSENKTPVYPDTWNSALVVVNRNRITHWLNGQKIVDVDTNSDTWTRGIAASKFKDHIDFGTNSNGRLMLQDHGHQVWFRELVLTPIETIQPIETVLAAQSGRLQSDQISSVGIFENNCSGGCPSTIKRPFNTTVNCYRHRPRILQFGRCGWIR